MGYSQYLITGDLVSISAGQAPARHKTGTNDTIRAQENPLRRQKFRSRVFLNHPWLRKDLEQNHLEELKAFGADYADEHLSKLNKILHIGQLNLSAASSDEIEQFAADYARRCAFMLEESETIVKKFLSHLGIERKLDEPLKKNVSSLKWWRNFIYKRKTESLAHVQRSVCNTYKSFSPYIDKESVKTHLKNKLKQRTYLENTYIRNELGHTVSLAEVSDTSISNPRIRRCELMTELRGISDWAENNGDSGTFVTLTTPSRMHRCYPSGKRNPAWDNTHVKYAQSYLQKVWSRVRAKLARAGIKIYGMRVVEPHHDGCPHWHLLVFVQPHRLKEFKEIFTEYALQDSPDEDGAREHRIEFLDNDKSKGDPIAYMAKYVSKNVDGFGLTEDDNGLEIREANNNIIAWARINNIRQFQFFGDPPRAIWRSLRKIEEPFENPELEAIRQAADKGEFETYINLMGGMNVPRDKRPIQSIHLPENCDPLTGELIGDYQTDQFIDYLQYQNLIIPIHFHTWTKVSPPDLSAQLESTCAPDVVGCMGARLRRNQEASSWTRDNNCTVVRNHNHQIKNIKPPNKQEFT